MAAKNVAARLMPIDSPTIPMNSFNAPVPADSPAGPAYSGAQRLRKRAASVPVEILKAGYFTRSRSGMTCRSEQVMVPL
jgi:hypothetical protein